MIQLHLSLLQSAEYVVYNQHQQCMQYLVEFSLPGDEEAGREEEEEEAKGEEKKEGEDEMTANDNEDTPTEKCI